METPRVTNVRVAKLRPAGYENLAAWMADPRHLYIGRNIRWVGAPKSDWHNPFSTKRYKLDECLQLYEAYVRDGPLWERLGELRGKVLGCWCVPGPCHGTVLVRLFRERFGAN